MNIIFLRGSIPPANEHPEKLYYTKIEECEDVWTQWFFYLCKKLNANGKLLYQGGNRKFVVNSFFTEKWVPSLVNYKPSFYPDMIIARGGFDYYDSFITRFPKSKKIYYGAGTRYFPQHFSNYDLFLVDSKKQFRKIKEKGKNVSLFIKPAALLFKPVNVEKKYDICFIANATQSNIKRHSLLIDAFANSKYKILNIGNTDKHLIRLAKIKRTDITWDGWSLRKKLPQKISQCKIGICCSTDYDSCARVIPEYLSVNLPIIVTDNVNFWKDKYITKQTGMIVDEKNIIDAVNYILNNYSQFNARKYYDEFLSIDKSTDHFIELIKGL